MMNKSSHIKGIKSEMRLSKFESIMNDSNSDDPS